MFARELEFHLESALLVTDVAGGDPNSEVGLSFLPGSVVRGILAARYQASPSSTDLSEFRRLFLSGAVTFLHAYPVIGQGEDAVRALPVPLSWHLPKDADPTTPVTDFAVVKPPEDNKTWKGMGGKWCAASKSASGSVVALVAEAGREVKIHTARADRQRPAVQGSAVFRYDALAAGQILRGAVIAQNKSDLETILGLVPSGTQVQVGRSQRAGYGRVRIEQGSEEWQEYRPGDATGAFVILTLLSDALVRNPNSGSWCAGLQHLTSAPLKEAYVRTRIVGGFNRTWGLPLPQAQAIAAGSVFVFAAEARADLEKLVATGVGERTVEGYGRVALNWQGAPTIKVCEGEVARAVNNLPMDPTAQLMAEQMVRRLWLQEADRRMTAYLARCRLDSPPSNAQLSRMRTAALRSAAGPVEVKKLAEVCTFLDGLKAIARRQFEQCYIESQTNAAQEPPPQRLLVWLRELAKNPAGVWAVIGMPPASGFVIGNATVNEEQDARLYAVRLIDTVAQRASRERDHD